MNAKLRLLAGTKTFGPRVTQEAIGQQTELVWLARWQCETNVLGPEARLLQGDDVISRRDIGVQFLVESSLLTATGGVLGTLLGVVGSAAIQSLAGWPTALSAAMLLTGLLTATAVGVGFGFYPAWEAARLEPMDALRRD